MVSVRWPVEAAAFDRRLNEALALFALLSRTPHVWPSPVHSAPADLVARLRANGFGDIGTGHVMVLPDPGSVSPVRPTDLGAGVTLSTIATAEDAMDGDLDDVGLVLAEAFDAPAARAPELAADLRVTLDDDRVAGRAGARRRGARRRREGDDVRRLHVPLVDRHRAAFRGRGLAPLVTRQAMAAAGGASRWAYLGVWSGNVPAIKALRAAGVRVARRVARPAARMTRWARLTWQAPDPGAFAAALAARLGVAVRPGAAPDTHALDLGTALLEVRGWIRESPTDMPQPGGRLMLEPIPGGEPAPEDDVPDAVRPLRLAGIGWATVELDRAEDELGMWLGDGQGSPAATAAADAVDPHLGAFARVRAAGGLPGDTFVLLEPTPRGASRRRSPGTARVRARSTCARRPASTAWSAAARRARRAAERQARRPARDRGPRSSRPARRPLSSSLGDAPRPSARTRPPGTIARMNDAPSITIRAATADDAERLAALFTDEGYPAGPSDIARRLERFVDARGSGVIVAEHGGEVARVRRVPRGSRASSPTTGSSGSSPLVVDAGARERGVGQALLAEVERVGARARASRSSRSPSGHHRPDARQLYESLGYDATVTAYLRKRL